MSSELFSDLSDREQEVVAGGAATLLNINQTSFFSHLQLLQASGTAVAGPNGASAGGTITGANQKINTSAFNLLFGSVD
ncbi:CTB family bacteriocin [Acaryochloris sp. IP29b_bin.148]|uniref:CTB family bacteriocin n=1 Tax=Acaryochloris sp. IP29b_bin.148 TaxID=2969218 RepID=UPI002605F87C|nr:CTB family bacteriocin [Acaryochloris sp. IP29b_bin.148]